MSFLSLHDQHLTGADPRTDDRGSPLQTVAVSEILSQYRGTPLPPTYSLGPAVRIGLCVLVIGGVVVQSATSSARASPNLWTPLLGMACVVALVMLGRNNTLAAANLTSRASSIWETASTFITPAVVVLALYPFILQAHDAGPWVLAAIGCYGVAGVALNIAVRRDSRRRPAQSPPRMFPQSPWLRAGAMLHFASTWIILGIVEQSANSNSWSMWYLILFGCLQTLIMYVTDRATARSVAVARISSPTNKLGAWLAAHNACGACGYRLDDSPVEPDGVRLCPECGAAWHRDRVTRPAPQPDEPNRLERLISLSADRGGVTDGRGVPLTRPMPRHLSEWLDLHSIDPEVRATLEEEQKQAWRRRLRESRPIAYVLVAALIGFVTWCVLKEPDALVFVLIVATLIAGMVIFAFLGVFVRNDLPVDIRDMIARHNVCPACGQGLPPVSEAQFDGCVCCRHCGLAWKPEPDRTTDAETMGVVAS